MVFIFESNGLLKALIDGHLQPYNHHHGLGIEILSVLYKHQLHKVRIIWAVCTSFQGTGTRSFDGFDMKCKTIIETLEEIPDASIASGLVSSLKDGDEDLYDLLDDDDTQFTFFVPLDSALGPFMESLEEPDAPAVVSEVWPNMSGITIYWHCLLSFLWDDS